MTPHGEANNRSHYFSRPILMKARWNGNDGAILARGRDNYHGLSEHSIPHCQKFPALPHRPSRDQDHSRDTDPQRPALPILADVHARTIAPRRVAALPVQLSVALSCRGRSCVQHSAIRRLWPRKSADSSVPARTKLSEPLWGRSARSFGPRKRTPISRSSAIATRGMHAATCLASFLSLRSCCLQSTQSSSSGFNDLADVERSKFAFHPCAGRE